MSQPNKQNVYIDATPLIGSSQSGIGNMVANLISELHKDKKFISEYTLNLFVPLFKTKHVEKWQFGNHVRVKEIPLPLRIINALGKFGLMIPVDIFLGKGVYMFTNYRMMPLLKSRAIVFVYDTVYKQHPETVQPANLNFLKREIPSAFRRANKIATLTQQTANELESIFTSYKHKICVVPAGVDNAVYKKLYSKAVSTKLYSKLGVKPQQYIFSVGNIEPRKNIEYLVDVYIQLVDKHILDATFPLVLVGGDGWNNESIVRKIQVAQSSGHKIVRPTFRLDNEQVAIMYQGALATFTFPVYEGFGMSPLESLAAGTMTFVSDIPAHREVLGDTVTYVPLADSDTAAKIISDELTLRKKETKSTGVILEKYSWVHSAEALKNTINEVAWSK